MQKNQEKFLYMMVSALGLALMIASKKISVPTESTNTETQYLFLIGALVFLSSIIGFVFSEEVTIDIDENTGKLQLSQKNYLRTKNRTFNFIEIEKLYIKTQRRKNLETYHLFLHLKNGEKIRTGRWSFQQDELLSEAHDLGQKIKCIVDMTTHFYEIDTKRILISTGGAILIYMIWYKATVGPFCPAMWYGTAPLVIIITSFLFLISILRRVDL